MNLQAAETAHHADKKQESPKAWNCPCTGCSKAVKQERERILNELNKIDINSPSQINALGMMILIKDIVSPPKKK